MRSNPDIFSSFQTPLAYGEGQAGKPKKFFSRLGRSLGQKLI